LVLGASSLLLEKAGIKPEPPGGAPDSGLLITVLSDASAATDSIAAVAKHRHLDRDMDIPPI
jgi:hypothetical protein